MTRKHLTLEWKTAEQFAEATRDFGVEVKDSTVQLVGRVVLTDEKGEVNRRDAQPIGGLIWARKDFWLDSVEVRGARVSPYVMTEGREWLSGLPATPQPTATLIVEVNGYAVKVQPMVLPPMTRPEPTEAELLEYWKRYWHFGWRTVEVPPDCLRPGLNTVIMRAEDGSQWDTLIETSRFPNRSAQSLDGGQTWNYDQFGYNECYDGELMVRMELDRHPPVGRLASAPFDLAQTPDGLGRKTEALSLSVVAEGETPPGTSITLELRSGAKPDYHPAHWTAWQPAAEFKPRPVDRFAQWQATLRTDKPLATPQLKSVRIAADLEVEEASWGSWTNASNPPILRSSHPFGYLAPTPRARMLRTRWRLDDVVAGALDDFEKVVRLAEWTREQWSDGWNLQHKALLMTPPWDASLILEVNRLGLGQGMCTHYSTVLVHACASLGIPARHLIMQAHCSTEAWSDRWGKWIWIDVGGHPDDDLQPIFWVERDGVPLSALEARDAWLASELDQLTMHGRNSDKAFKLSRLHLLVRFFIPMRNDQMTSLNPGESEHGTYYYHYDGYLWWEDEKTRPLPWFSQISSRRGDFYWTPNRTRLHPQRMPTPGTIKFMLETSMPNFASFQVKVNDGGWRNTPDELILTLPRGGSTIAARSISTFGVEGPACALTVRI